MLYAHIDHKNGKYQNLVEHLRQSADICTANLSVLSLRDLAQLVGLLHDAGKASDVFQEYLKSPSERLRGKINHSSHGARILDEIVKDDDIFSKTTIKLCALAICGHHSGLTDCFAFKDEENLLEKRMYPKKEIHFEQVRKRYFEQCVPQEEIERLFHAAREEVRALWEKVNIFFVESPSDGMVEEKRFMMGMVAKMLHSSLLDADRYDTFQFYADYTEQTEKQPTMLWQTLLQGLEQNLKKRSSKQPLDEIRKRISQSCYEFAKRPSGTYQLYVPTGGGKTLSSFRYALRHAELTNAPRIFYIAPYKIILEQNAKVMRDIVKEETALVEEEFILEHHGDVISDCFNQTLQTSFGDADVDYYQLFTQRWPSSYMIFTTMVQFLETLFSGKSGSARRLNALAGSVIILDEIQTLPAKFVSMVNTAINFLQAVCGCSIVLCTATQPGLESVPVPLRISSPRNMVPPEQTALETFDRVEIVDMTTHAPFKASELAVFVHKQWEKQGTVLAVMNTKAAAHKLYCAIKEQNPEVEVYYLSTALCPQNRLDILEQIKEKLKQKQKLICISTQLIEAGVDISFGCVIRSMAGLDSIAQAAGRCNRNKEVEKGKVYIIKNGDENLKNLKDIADAQNAVGEVLYNFKMNPARFQNSLLSREAVTAYYAQYYQDKEDKKVLDYPIEKEDKLHISKQTSAYSLLSDNELLYDRDNLLRQEPFKQAFATAGKKIKALETEGVDVLVPYGEEGKAIIAALHSNLDAKQLSALLRHAQRYLVHLFEYEKRNLEENNALHTIAEKEIFVVEEGFYNKEHGIVIDRGIMELMQY